MNRKANLVFCAVFMAALAGCGVNNSNTAALVNGAKIEKKTYEATLENLVARQKQMNTNFVDNEQNRLVLGRMALEQLITNEVLAQEAAKANINADEKTIDANIQNLKQRFAFGQDGQRITDEAQIDKNFHEKLKKDGISLQQLKNNIHKELNAQLFLNDLSSKQKVELKEDTLQQFYKGTMALVANDQKALQSFSKDDVALMTPFAVEVQKNTAARATVSAIFLATPKSLAKEKVQEKQKSAQKIAQELKDKKITFVDAIQKYSDDKAALRTNGEQTVLKGTLPAGLDKKIFEAQLNKVLDPITEQDGIYVLRVNQRQAKKVLSYEQLRNDIIKYLAAFQIKYKVQQQVKDLVLKANVKVLLPQYQVNKPEKAK